MKFYGDVSPDYGIEFDDVLIRPAYSELTSRLDTNPYVTISKNRHVYTLAPIVVANMVSTATLEMYKAVAPLGVMVPFHRFQSIDAELLQCQEAYRFYREIEGKNPGKCAPVGATIGLHDEIRTNTLCDSSILAFVFLELAHADQAEALKEVKRISTSWPEIILVVGNVATTEATKRLIDAGADVVKCGIGPSPVCRTRSVTGCGVPQLSAIDECFQTILNEESRLAFLIADGGIKSSGDICKALAAGADMVMTGSLFAGTEETGNALGDGSFIYMGMASRDAAKIGDKIKEGIVPEGVSLHVPGRGKAFDVASDLIAGIRQGMAMIGAERVGDLADATFQLVSPRTKVL